MITSGGVMLSSLPESTAITALCRHDGGDTLPNNPSCFRALRVVTGASPIRHVAGTLPSAPTVQSTVSAARRIGSHIRCKVAQPIQRFAWEQRYFPSELTRVV
jgi:hypothetical protein